MKRRTQDRNQVDQSLSTLHFHLCHVCLHLNESEAFITQCANCTRVLTLNGAEKAKEIKVRRVFAAPDLDGGTPVGGLTVYDLPSIHGLQVVF